MGYSIDTSAIIELKRRYRTDIFASLWSEIEHLIHTGRLIAHTTVYIELEEKHDELFKWSKGKNIKKMFKKDFSKGFMDVFEQIQNDYPDLVDYTSSKTKADPFVIALAAHRSLIVITHERIGVGKTKIPNVCRDLNIPCLFYNELPDFFEIEGWSF